MRLLGLVAVLPFVVSTGPAYAWGQEGHSIVAEIAQRHLTPFASARMRELLGGDISLASISSWADDVRGERPTTYNWHFVDIPLADDTFDPKRDCVDDPAKGDCVINEIERNKRTLKDPSASAEDKREALKYVVHFVGDLHQPLHTVKDAAGGNTVQVTFFSDPTNRHIDQTNLHAVWDSGLIRNYVWAWGDVVEKIETAVIGKVDATAVQKGTPTEWALEAHKAAQDVAFTVSSGANLDAAYAAQARPVLMRQLARAGLRLARTLNDIWQ
jgi:nuclease S1